MNKIGLEVLDDETREKYRGELDLDEHRLITYRVLYKGENWDEKGKLCGKYLTAKSADNKSYKILVGNNFKSGVSTKSGDLVVYENYSCNRICENFDESQINYIRLTINNDITTDKVIELDYGTTPFGIRTTEYMWEHSVDTATLKLISQPVITGGNDNYNVTKRTILNITFTKNKVNEVVKEIYNILRYLEILTYSNIIVESIVVGDIEDASEYKIFYDSTLNYSTSQKSEELIKYNGEELTNTLGNYISIGNDLAKVVAMYLRCIHSSEHYLYDSIFWRFQTLDYLAKTRNEIKSIIRKVRADKKDAGIKLSKRIEYVEKLTALTKMAGIGLCMEAIDELKNIRNMLAHGDSDVEYTSYEMISALRILDCCIRNIIGKLTTSNIKLLYNWEFELQQNIDLLKKRNIRDKAAEHLEKE